LSEGIATILGEEAVRARRALVETVRAEVVVAALAVVALAAGEAWLQRHAVALPPPRHVGAHLHDLARRLVAQHGRRGEKPVADAALVVPVDVRTANANGLDVDEHLVRPGQGARALLDAQIVDTVEYSCLHFITSPNTADSSLRI
jgi:hypothetical protein